MKRLLRYRDVWLIGSGGKTTLMFTLASLCQQLGKSVLCTTTTKIWAPSSEQCADVRLGQYDALTAGLRRLPSIPVTVASHEQGGKLVGFGPEQAMQLSALADHVIVEADGSAGLPVKAHAAHEPVLHESASCVVAVVGGWCIGKPLDSHHVHRPQLFSELSGRLQGDTIRANDVAAVLLGPGGWLERVPGRAAVHLVVTGPGAELFSCLERHERAASLAGLHRWATSSSTLFS